MSKTQGSEMAPIRDVMVFTPVYRLEPETMKAVFDLKWDGAITHVFQKDNPISSANGANDTNKEEKTKDEIGKANHLHQFQRGRETFLAGRYDAMLIIESDIVPPKDALMKLAALNVDLAYGVYRFRQGNIVNIFERYPDNNYTRARNTGESLSVHPWLLAAAVRKQKIPCSGGGFGCLLARRQVIEQIPFRMEPGSKVHCDTWFTKDAYSAGFSQMADMSVVCCHIDEDGSKLWPCYPATSFQPTGVSI